MEYVGQTSYLVMTMVVFQMSWKGKCALRSLSVLKIYTNAWHCVLHFLALVAILGALASLIGSLLIVFYHGCCLKHIMKASVEARNMIRIVDNQSIGFNFQEWLLWNAQYLKYAGTNSMQKQTFQRHNTSSCQIHSTRPTLNIFHLCAVQQ